MYKYIMEKFWDSLNSLMDQTQGFWDIVITIFVKSVQIVFFMIFAIVFLPSYLVVTYGHKMWAKMLTDLLKLR